MAESAAERVRSEMERFRAALPALLETLPNRWVVFLDGEVKSDHDSEADAYEAGLKSFGVAGGFVVARVTEDAPVPISAAFLFGAA